jgi:hypothetical protein
LSSAFFAAVNNAANADMNERKNQQKIFRILSNMMSTFD